MSEIRVLPDQVANRIAAGEVVERPIAVVKELVDNSIDAGATRIQVSIKQGGKASIVVEDDGRGMDPDDASLCLERHATSKIASSDDLFAIQTLGFRGEALPSIASVSRFKLTTRYQDSDEGTEILVNGGKIISKKAVGSAKGTRIEVTHLFNSIPARRKFLKTDNTEASHIIQWMRQIALAHPTVSFRLQSNNRNLFSLPSGQSLEDRIYQLWGHEIKGQLVPIRLDEDGMTASGFIGKAGVSRPSRHDIINIVNGRPVESRTLGFAFTEAYHTLIPKGKYPLVFFHLKIDPSLIDVNIHPSKREIKFKAESRVRNAVIRAVWDLLKTPDIPTTGPVTGNPIQTKSSPGESQNLPPVTPLYSTQPPQQTSSTVPQGPSTIPVTTHQSISPELKDNFVKSATGKRPPPDQPPKSLQRDWRYIGSYSRVYSVFERSSGLTMVHNHRANHRIEFEKWLGTVREGTGFQMEAIPTAFELSPHLDLKLEPLLPKLTDCLIDLEQFGRNCYRITQVPSFIEPGLCQDLILKWLNQSSEANLTIETMQQELVLNGTEASSYRLQLPLNEEESFDLLNRLLNCEHPMTDPVGRPSISHFNHRTISGE